MIELFISCNAGFEEVLRAELLSLGYQGKNAGPGGLYVDITSFQEVYKLNLVLRTASRVLFPIATLACKDAKELYAGASKIRWTDYFRGLPSFSIDSHVVNNRAFKNSLYAAQVMKDAICDQLRKKWGKRPSVETMHPAIRLNIFIHLDKATISFDTSGRPLHERGYRQAGGTAPLRETVAAGLLFIAEYKGSEILVDPCCGSGTFLIEAAMMATKTPPGILRKRFGFMSHPEYNRDEFESAKKELTSQITKFSGKIIGIEKNGSHFSYLKEAISNSGFADVIEVIKGDFYDITLQNLPDFVIVNPPYGIRLQDEKDYTGLYQDLGDFMKQKTAKPARGFVLAGTNEIVKNIGLRTKKRHEVTHGGLECRFLEYDLF